MEVKIYYDNARIREFTNISMVYDNLHTNTYDLHYRIPKDDILDGTSERMTAIDKEGVARIHIKGGNDDQDMEKLRI